MLISCNYSFAQVNSQAVTLVTIDQKPYGFQIGNKNQSGMLYEIIDELSKLPFVDTKHAILPTNRLLATLNSDKAVCSVLADTYTVKNNFQLIAPIGVKFNVGVITKKPIPLNNYQQLKKLHVAIPLGMKINEQFDNDTSIKKTYPPKYSNLVEMFKHDYIDAIAGVVPVLTYLADDIGINLEQLSKPLLLNTIEFYIVCNYNLNPLVKKRLENAFVNARESGKFEQIINKYFKSNTHLRLNN